jgi:Spy/CpxP family protein refolding chaperone
MRAPRFDGFVAEVYRRARRREPRPRVGAAAARRGAQEGAADGVSAHERRRRKERSAPPEKGELDMRQLHATIVSLLLAAPVLAAPGGWGRGGGPGFGSGGPGDRIERRAERVADLLELDDAQRTAFDQMLGAGLAAARPKLDQMRALHQELEALLDSGSTDEAAIGAKLLAIHRLRAELRAGREAARAEFVALLSDEQRFAFEAFDEMREMRRGRQGRRGAHGFGGGAGGPELD